MEGHLTREVKAVEKEEKGRVERRRKNTRQNEMLSSAYAFAYYFWEENRLSCVNPERCEDGIAGK